MKLFIARLEGKTIFYFSLEEYYWKKPHSYIFKSNERWFIGGSVYISEHTLPDKFSSKGFKTLKLALSYLYEIAKYINTFDKKIKAKFCLTGRDGKEYQAYSILKANQFYLEMNPIQHSKGKQNEKKKIKK